MTLQVFFELLANPEMVSPGRHVVTIDYREPQDETNNDENE